MHASIQRHLPTVLVSVFGLCAYLYFGIDTRWKLSGTWNCNRVSNGAAMQDTYSLFGTVESKDENSAIPGMTVTSKFSLSGKEMVMHPISARVGERVKEFEGDDYGSVSIHIGKLTRSELIYNARVNNGRLDAVTCTR